MIAAAVPPGAAASMRQESIMEDPVQLLQDGPQVQAAALDDMASLGVDTVRVRVTWRDFAGTRSAPYPDSAFATLDALVQGAADRGMHVLLTPSSPIPRWASGCHGSAVAVQACKPDPKLFGAFVRVLGTRYPSVHRWGIWNEPNLATWLKPQVSPAGVAVAAQMYRGLATAAVSALRKTGHGSDTILLGETAPVGHALGPPAERNLPPVDFWQALLCVKGHRDPGCKGASRLRVTGIAHHPYTQGAYSPPFAHPAPGQISFTSIGRLERVLRQGARAGLIAPHLPIWFTEFGYQSNPPDPILGVPLKAQATYLNLADFLAARNPRVHAVSQYQLVDDANEASFQTGLERFGSLAHKPSYDAYRLPIWVQRRGARVRVYGQLRAAPARSRQTVTLQRSPAPGKPFATVRSFAVRGATHQFVKTLPFGVGVWRLKWKDEVSRATPAYAKP